MPPGKLKRLAILRTVKGALNVSEITETVDNCYSTVASDGLRQF